MAPRKPAAKKKPAPKRKPLGAKAQAGKTSLQQSYGTGKAEQTANPTTAGMAAVMDYYKGLSPKDRAAGYRDLQNAAANRDLSKWAGTPTGVLFSELPKEARDRYWAAKRGGTSPSAGAASGTKVAPWENQGNLPGTSVVKFGTSEDEKSGGGGKKKKPPKKKGKGKDGGSKAGSGRQKRGVKAGYHTNTSGQVVKNKGKRSPRKVRKPTGPR